MTPKTLAIDDARKRIAEARQEGMLYARARMERLADTIEELLGLLTECKAERDVWERQFNEEHTCRLSDEAEYRKLIDAQITERDSLRSQLVTVERERNAYRKAKQENDARFMNERDQARQERDSIRALLAEACGIAKNCGDRLLFDKEQRDRIAAIKREGGCE